MFSEQERERRLNAAAQLIKDENLAAIYLIGNGTVGTNAFGCFRYFTDNRVFFQLTSAVITPDGSLIAIAGSELGKVNLMRGSFVKDAVVNGDQIAGVVQILKDRGIEKGRLGILTEVLPAPWAHRLMDAMPGLELVDISEAIFKLRLNKVEEEVEVQKVCGAIADAGYKAFCEAARPGAKEHELVAAAEYAMQKMGMEQSFMIITSGRFSATDNQMSTLHNTSSIDRTLQAGDSVAMEITPKYQGYWTQIVRTISIQEPNTDLDEFRRVTVGAINAAKTILRAGIPISAVVKKIGEYIEGEGYRMKMPCGHIAGLDLNEERMTEDNDRLILPGMMLIIHPTVVNDKLESGIFWGESYIATEEGYEAVMQSPDELYISK